LRKLVIGLCWVLAALAVEAMTFANDSEAIAKLLNSRASGSPKTYAEAAAAVVEAAAEGKLLQQYIVAVIGREPYAPAVLKVDDATAKRYLEASRDKIMMLAEKKSNALAWYLLSIENNDLKMLKRAAEGDNLQALNAWGTHILMQALENPMIESNELVRVEREAFDCFRKAGVQKDPNGIYNLGMCYVNGYGCAVDREQALRSFRTAAEAGHPDAMNSLGCFYRDGIVVERDAVVAVRWFAKSAALENSYGQFNYALALKNGAGVEKNLERSAALLKLAAEQDNFEAMNVYGMCLFNGDGVKADEAEAVKWYRRAAALGFAPAMDNLSVCYAMGKGGLAVDDKLATVWKVRARAASGDRNAAAWLNQNGYSLR